MYKPQMCVVSIHAELYLFTNGAIESLVTSFTLQDIC